MLTLILTQEEAEALFDACDGVEAEYGFRIGDYPWCSPTEYQAAQDKGKALMERLHRLAHS